MDQDDTDRRLEALEVKASFADDLLDELNNTVARQQMQIQHLMAQLRAL
jgi:SlyX protein